MRTDTSITGAVSFKVAIQAVRRQLTGLCCMSYATTLEATASAIRALTLACQVTCAETPKTTIVRLTEAHSARHPANQEPAFGDQCLCLPVRHADCGCLSLPHGGAHICDHHCGIPGWYRQHAADGSTNFLRRCGMGKVLYVYVR